MRLHTHLSLLLAGLAVSASVLAGPAEDALAQVAELRKAIVTQEERIIRLEAQLQNQGLLNLLNQVETLKSEVARLRGGQDEQAYRLESADKRSRELFADLDDRIKELASRPAAPPADAVRLQVAQSLTTAAPPAPAPVDSENEAQAYESAHAMVKSAKYKEAVAAMQAFLKQYPNGSLAPNALYWTGFSYVGQSDFKNAASYYQRLLKEYPLSPKAPDAMLSLARTQVQMNDPDAARETLDQLNAKYPQSKAADNGKKLLSILK